MYTTGYNSGELSVWVLFARTVMNLSFDCGVLRLFNAHQCWFCLWQLRLVLHICSRVGLRCLDLLTRLHPQANGQPMEVLLEALCSAYGFKWTYQRFTGFSELPGTDYV